MRENIQNSSMIVISHQERILSIADEIAVLEDGRIGRHGTRDEVYPTLIGTEAAQEACERLK
jgi:Fe-S cluster assembly ATP-binding protein